MNTSISTTEKRQWRHGEGRAAYFFLAPSLLLYSLYVIFPIFYTGYLSFTDWDGISSFPLPICIVNDESSCWSNYLELLDDPVFWTSFRNNLTWLVFFSLSPLVGLALALFFHTKGKLASFYKSLIYSPMVFSLVVVGLIWSWFLQPEFGLVEYLLHAVGLLSPDQHFNMMADFTWATAGLIIAACWPHAAYCMILFLTGLSNLNKSVIEAAMIDGVNGWQMIRHVIVPMLRPATIVVILVTVIGALRTFELVAVMTAGGPANSSNVLANYMYQQTFQSFRYGFGAAIAVVLFMISLVIITAYLHQTRKNELG